MSWSERSVRYHKRQTDCAIRHAYARLATDARSVAIFDELLHYARSRAARLLEAPVLNGHHPGVEALVNLSRFGSAHIRPAAEWSGTASSWRLAVWSLAHHLVCKYEIPVFLASSWYSSEDAAADKKRGWFVGHARGASFRSLNLPIVMTRRMERIFLASHDHLEIEHAIRRAELLALGARFEFVQAVLSTRLATDLRNGMFWRTVWSFLIANAGTIDPAQIGPMIDFHKVVFDRSRFCSLGKRFPTRRGRPARLGRRSGGGANKRASVRSRVIQVMGRRSDCMRVRNSRAEKA
jgi:hypothetical protein